MKTAELTGALLDYWVAKAEGLAPEIGDGACYLPQGGEGWYRPSSDWAEGGPIIEREKGEIRIQWAPSDGDQIYLASMSEVPRGCMTGPTHLVAAMRAYVASKFGEEVSDESA